MKSLPAETEARNGEQSKFENEDFQCEISILASQCLALGKVIEPLLREAKVEHVTRIADGDLDGEAVVQIAGMLLDKLHELNRELKV